MKKHSVIILFLLVAFCVAPVFSQEKPTNKKELISESASLQKTPSSENKCWKYGAQDFVGKLVTIEFADKDIREVVRFFLEQCDGGIIIDSSIKPLLITAKFMDVPWNIALNTILQSQGLGVKVIGPILRVAEVKTLERDRERAEQERKWLAAIRVAEDTEDLYTESFKLKKPCCRCDKDGCNRELSRDELQGLITRRLSKRGRVEVDKSLHTLVVTDIRFRLAVIKELIGLLNGEN